MNMQSFYFIFLLLNTITENVGLMPQSKLKHNPVLLKTLQSTEDAAASDVTSNSMRSLCSCLQEKLKKHNTFSGESNLLLADDEASQESDIKFYKHIYKRACTDLDQDSKDNKSKIVKDIEEIVLNKALQDDIGPIKQYKNLTEHPRKKEYRLLYETLIKGLNNHNFKIQKYPLYKHKVAFDSKDERGVIIIITLHPLLNNSISQQNFHSVNEEEVNETLNRNISVEIDIIDSQFTNGYELISTVKKCHLYSLYIFLIESGRKKSIKDFKLLRVKGTIKIYVNVLTNLNLENFPEHCCNTSLLTLCENRINSEKNVFTDINHMKYEKKKIENFENIISKIKNLIYLYNAKVIQKDVFDDEFSYTSSDDTQHFSERNYAYTNKTILSISDLRMPCETENSATKRDIERTEEEKKKPTILENIWTNLTVTDWWLDDMYLKVRHPLPINSNPGMVFPRRQFAKIDEVADLAALYIDDLLDYKEMLDRGELPQERATSREKGQPLCMEQFYRLLGVCRIPEVGKDRLELPNTPNNGAEREELVIVACRNYFYPIPVKAVDRGRLTPGEIQAQLLTAMVDAAGAPPAPRVGILTAINRDQWAKAREQLIKDENNRANLELISRALCIMCVDEAGGDRAELDSDTNALLRAMHGGGTRHHSANRWFDKTVQLIISSDGTVGMCYEHSPAEGVAVVRLAERALARAEVSDRPAPPPVLLPAPQPMKWNLNVDLQRTIEHAARDFDRAISDLDLKVYTYRNYGREFMKSCRTSPDVYIQLAMQYAYYKLYGYLVSTYESASLRRFRNGRVDNIRSAHSAAQAWASAMCSADTPPQGDEDGQKKVSFNLYGEQKKLELFEEAARKQTAIMEANILGRGIDNHLLGLREAARESLGALPDLFTDPTYSRMVEFKLSTSQVATTTDGTFMGYGAVVPDGYGCSYNPKKDCVIFCISSFVSSSVTNTEAFRQSLEEALDSMKLMFQHRKTES